MRTSVDPCLVAVQYVATTPTPSPWHRPLPPSPPSTTVSQLPTWHSTEPTLVEVVDDDEDDEVMIIDDPSASSSAASPSPLPSASAASAPRRSFLRPKPFTFMTTAEPENVLRRMPAATTIAQEEMEAAAVTTAKAREPYPDVDEISSPPPPPPPPPPSPPSPDKNTPEMRRKRKTPLPSSLTKLPPGISCTRRAPDGTAELLTGPAGRHEDDGRKGVSDLEIASVCTLSMVEVTALAPAQGCQTEEQPHGEEQEEEEEENRTDFSPSSTSIGTLHERGGRKRSRSLPPTTPVKGLRIPDRPASLPGTPDLRPPPTPKKRRDTSDSPSKSSPSKSSPSKSSPDVKKKAGSPSRLELLQRRFTLKRDEVEGKGRSGGGGGGDGGGQAKPDI